MGLKTRLRRWNWFCLQRKDDFSTSTDGRPCWRDAAGVAWVGVMLLAWLGLAWFCWRDLDWRSAAGVFWRDIVRCSVTWLRVALLPRHFYLFVQQGTVLRSGYCRFRGVQTFTGGYSCQRGADENCPLILNWVDSSGNANGRKNGHDRYERIGCFEILEQILPHRLSPFASRLPPTPSHMNFPFYTIFAVQALSFFHT